MRDDLKFISFVISLTYPYKDKDLGTYIDRGGNDGEVKKELRRKRRIPPVGSGNASVVNDSLTRCGSILFRRKKETI